LWHLQEFTLPPRSSVTRLSRFIARRLPGASARREGEARAAAEAEARAAAEAMARTLAEIKAATEALVRTVAESTAATEAVARAAAGSAAESATALEYRLSTLDGMAQRLTQIEALGRATAVDVAEVRLMLAALSLPDPALWQGCPAPVEGAPGTDVFPRSTICRQESFDEPWFAWWTRELGEHLRYHRKLWEFTFILQALWERGAIRPGARGLGFGVGMEPLTAWFAAQGCQITATDMAADRAEESGWISSNEHASGKAALRRPAICPEALFDANVEFRNCDMNAVADDLTGYDFCWSACAFEHLGSIEAGLRFVERSVETLKPGGWAIHTTEFNMSSNDQTVDDRDTVLFRRRDLEDLQQRLEARGHRVAPFDFTPGVRPIDRYIDIAPYRSEPHLILALWGHQTTSIGLIVQRGP
jgi:2-polyprenyl-3-methyl-5-hydroxy-6-metoxy-1,4-benzoquinol methylase